MKKLFAITCHKVTDPLIFTVNYLSSFQENTILIHVDYKSKIDNFKFLTKKNVIILEDRVSVQWGGYSQVLAMLYLMKESGNYDYEYFSLISGDDLPVKNNSEMNDFLRVNKGSEFIHYQVEDNQFIIPDDRVKYSYPDFFLVKKKSIGTYIKKKIFFLLRNVLYLNKEYHSNGNVVFYKGTNWFTLTKGSIDFILNFVSSNDWYTSLFKKSLCGDEVFFHTILKMNPNLKVYNESLSSNSALSNALRFIDWDSGPEYPKILNFLDFTSVQATPAFFARKFPEKLDSEFVRCFNERF